VTNMMIKLGPGPEPDGILSRLPLITWASSDTLASPHLRYPLCSSYRIYPFSDYGAGSGQPLADHVSTTQTSPSPQVL
jgi:hypothetical protein